MYIVRRLLAIASEDIGNADPRAMQIAISAWDCFTRIGPAEYAAGENYLPPEMAQTRYYQPSNHGLEGKIRDKLEYLADLDAKSPKKRE